MPVYGEFELRRGKCIPLCLPTPVVNKGTERCCCNTGHTGATGSESFFKLMTDSTVQRRMPHPPLVIRPVIWIISVINESEECELQPVFVRSGAGFRLCVFQYKREIPPFEAKCRVTAMIIRQNDRPVSADCCTLRKFPAFRHIQTTENATGFRCVTVLLST